MSRRINLLIEKRTTTYSRNGRPPLASSGSSSSRSWFGCCIWLRWSKPFRPSTCRWSAPPNPPGRRTSTVRYQTFDPAGSERNYLLSIFGDGTFSYAHRADGGTFSTDLSAEGTVGAEEKVGLEPSGRRRTIVERIRIGSGLFGMRGESP